MQSPHWSGLDTALAAVTLAALAAIVATGVYWSSLSVGARVTFLLLAGLVALQGLSLMAWRRAHRRAIRRGSDEIGLDGRLLLIAGGMLFSGLVMAAGLAMAVVAAVYQPGGPQALGGWLGGSFGCFCGGAGGLMGCWNSYRKMEGAADVWATGQVTWFEYVIAGYFLVGAVSMGLGLLGPSQWHDSLLFVLRIVGGVVLFQSLICGVIRALTIRAGRQERALAGNADKPRREGGTP
jgi:hypothetical protein